MSKHLKILILEDFAFDAELIQLELKKAGVDFASKVVNNRSDFINALTDYNPDVIISDHTLPQFDSRSALKIYKEHKLNCPFILVTGTVSEEFAVASIHEGADDYILKGNLTRLPSAIDNALKKREAEREKEFILETIKAQNIELSRINKELDHLVYSASHDLRSPLTSILGLLYILKAEKDETKQQHFLQLVEKSVRKLDSIIKDIIIYARNNRRDVTIEEVNLEELIKDTFTNLQSQYTDNVVDLKITVNGSTSLFTDKERLGIIVNNTLSNAIVYNDKEKKTIVITAEINKSDASITIQDNGPGISEKHIDKIFDMFYRGTEKSTGTGLGLYIVKEYLRKLNGTIAVNSQEGTGSTFKIDIPNNTKK